MNDGQTGSLSRPQERREEVQNVCLVSVHTAESALLLWVVEFTSKEEPSGKDGWIGSKSRPQERGEGGPECLSSFQVTLQKSN